MVVLGHTCSLPLAHLPALTSTCIAIWLSHFSSPRRTVCCISPISTQSPSVPYWRLQCQFTSVVWIVWLDHHRHPNRPGMSRYAAHCRRLHTLAIRRLQRTPSCPIFECPTGEYPLSVLHPVPDSAYRRSLSVNTTLRRRCQPTLLLWDYPAGSALRWQTNVHIIGLRNICLPSPIQFNLFGAQSGMTAIFTALTTDLLERTIGPKPRKNGQGAMFVLRPRSRGNQVKVVMMTRC